MDLEAIKSLRDGLGWQELRKEIDNRINISLDRLKTCKVDEVIFLQERIKALEELKRMPDSMVIRES